MKPIEGRLQTAEHILAKIIENKINCNVGVCKFYEDYGTLEIYSETDIRELGKEELAKQTNKIINSNLDVEKKIIAKQNAKEFDLSRIPKSVKEIRIVDIKGFDKRPCKDPHVDNTSQIGNFIIQKIKRVGKGRYRITFKVEY